MFLPRWTGENLHILGIILSCGDEAADRVAKTNFPWIRLRKGKVGKLKE